MDVGTRSPMKTTTIPKFVDHDNPFSIVLTDVGICEMIQTTGNLHVS